MPRYGGAAKRCIPNHICQAKPGRPPVIAVTETARRWASTGCMKFAGKFRALSIMALLLSLGQFVQFAQAQPIPKDAECLACHSDPTLTTDVNGKKVSLAVDPGKMKASVHGSMFSCVDCHKDIKSSPHENTPAKITCAQCHADAQAAYSHSYHASAKKPDGSTPATCVNCHGDAHTILPASDPKPPIYHSNIPATCGPC